MKSLILVLMALIVVPISSCGKMSYSEFLEEGAKVFCKKVFTCDEGEGIRQNIPSEKACIEAMKQEDEEEYEKDSCKNYSASNADKCISCLKTLSCAQFFGEDESLCPACDKVCEWDFDDDDWEWEE